MDAWWYMFCLHFKFLGKSQNGRLMYYVDLYTSSLSMTFISQIERKVNNFQMSE